MLAAMLSLVVVLASSTLAAAPDAAPAAAAAAPPAVIDEGAVVEAVEAALAHSKDVVRIAVPPVADADGARRRAVEIAIVRAILDRRHEEPITPAYIRAKVDGADSPDKLRPLACDHILSGAVLEEGGKAVLHLKLIKSETAEVIGEESAALGNGKQTSASAGNVRLPTDRIVEELAFAVEAAGDDVHTHRIAVTPLAAEGAAKEARLDRFTQSELLRALKRRGFLVVEREQLAQAMDQLALGQELEEKSAPALGKALGAQSLVVGRVADAGTSFVVNVRLLSAEDGKVVGAAEASLPRQDVVGMADVETRTPLEAAVRSAVAPGWGQAYNGQGLKALAFGVGGYAGIATTAALGVGGLAVQAHYNDVPYFERLPPAQASKEAVDARNTFTALYASTAIAGGVTVAIWGAGVVDAIVSAPKN